MKKSLLPCYAVLCVFFLCDLQLSKKKYLQYIDGVFYAE